MEFSKSFGPAKYKHVLCRRRIRGVEEDDKKVKEDFKILIFFGLAFSLETPSFHSILILFS